MESSSTKVVFKGYNSQQLMLLPPSLDELIDTHHPVRVVEQVIEHIDIQPIINKYKGGGTSSYHPRMLLKVLVYAYLSNVYSSRKIEAALKENIHFMWLSGMSRPDHNTINRFRSDRLKDVLKEVFSQVVMLLTEAGHVDLKEVYTDGTKIEANANKYTFVWGKAIKTNKERIAAQLEELWNYSQQVAQEELNEEVPDFACVEPEKVEQTIEKINTALQGKAVSKKVKQKLSYAKKHWPGKLKEYKQKEEILAGRNSFSKTDQDATFMRMKDDHMQNGQLKPGYNLQISTNHQFITHYSIHQNPTDTTTLIPHFQEFNKLYKTLPQSITADAGYGSQQNYEYLEEQQVEAYVKYPYFHKEQKEKEKEKYFDNLRDIRNLHYNPEQDCYYCPMGQPMENIGVRKRTTTNNYEQHYTRYRAKNCHGCPLRAACHKQKGNRVIEVNHTLNRFKEKARENLLSEKGIAHRKQRPWDVETVFGNIKQNKGFKRFMLRGLRKVEIETGLIALAHNLAKLAA
jgi:transposase